MSVTQPTVQELTENIVSQLEVSLNQTIPLLPKAFNRVLAKAVAGVFVLLYKYGGFIFLQLFVSTASARETEINGRLLTPLVEWGRLVGAGDPAPAVQAEHTIDITVENQVGSLDAGAQLLDSNTGVTHITLGGVLLNAPVVQATVRAVADQSGGDGSGTIGNMDAGAVLSFVNPLANVAREATVAAQTVTGANGESVDAYRQRIIDRFQKRPQGGAPADYELWAEEPAGLIGAWPYKSGDCPGQINVYIEATPASSGNPDGIPTPAQLQTALDSINFDVLGLASRRSANALVNALPITRAGFDVEVIGLIVDDPPDVQAAITAAVTEYFLSREPFIAGLTPPPRADLILQTDIAAIVSQIVSANNGLFTGLAVKLGGGIVSSYTLGEGEKAKALSVSFI